MEYQDQGVMDCQVDDTSSTSKENNDEDHKIMTSSTASMSTADLEKSSGDKFSVEEDKKCATRAYTHEPLLHGQSIADSDRSVELVDVRVCDICGDVGRESLLALCSKCCDGAEHIYCMRIKMDKVPEDDWICEECMLLQEPKRQRQVEVERLDSTLNPSKSEEISQNLLTINSRKRPGPVIEVRRVPKRRTLEKSVQPLKSNGSEGKTLLSRVSSLKNMDKGKNAACQVSSLGNQCAKKLVGQACLPSIHRSPKSRQQFNRGLLCKSKSINLSGFNMVERKTVEEIDGSKCIKRHPEKKLRKSMSFSGVSLNMTNARLCLASKVKGRVPGRELNSNEKYGLAERKSSQGVLPFAGSNAMKVDTSGTKADSKIDKAPFSSRNFVKDMKSIQVNGYSNAEALGSVACEGENNANKLARSVGENLSPSQSSYELPSPAKNVKSYSDRKASQPPKKTEIWGSQRDDNGHLVARHNILPDNLRPVKDMPILAPTGFVPSTIVAVPKSEYIWKGSFKLEEGGKLPNECNGIQAHLSTCASSKVLELALKFRPKILLKELTRSKTWPSQFEKNQPMEQDIALYFFAEDLQSYGRSYKMLLDGIMENDLVLEANIDGVQLLVFPSSLLPVRSQSWNTLPFLWGVFRVRKDDNCGLQIPTLDVVATLNQGTEFVDPMVLQSPSSTKSMRQSFKHDVYSADECLFKEEKHDLFCCKADTKETFSGGELCSDGIQKGSVYTNQDMKIVSQSNKDDMVSKLGEEEKRISVASRSSFSFDSGPSGSSDGGGFCKLDEGQVDQLQNPASHTALSVDLCLGTGVGSEPKRRVDLDLVLGFPSTSRYKPEHSTKDSNGEEANVSLVLSLGMPCSDG